MEDFGMSFLNRGARESDRRRNILWWVYFFYALAASAFWVSYVAPRILEMPSRIQLAGAALTLLEAWALVGLWGFLRFKALGTSWVWTVCLGIKTTHFFVIAFEMVRGNSTLGTSNISSPYYLLALCGLLLEIPLLIALLRYSFFSTEIWAQQSRKLAEEYNRP
jgi:hypothetical protein